VLHTASKCFGRKENWNVSENLQHDGRPSAQNDLCICQEKLAVEAEILENVKSEWDQGDLVVAYIRNPDPLKICSDGQD